MAAPSGTLASVPAEHVVRIFQDCNSFADLRALLLTCRYVHSVWVANIPSIIWNVAPKLIPAFDRGLIAARATELVHAAFRNGLPPDIPLEKITGASRKPDLFELREVLDLAHLVRYIDARYCNLELPEGYWFWESDYHWNQSPYQRWPVDRGQIPVNPPEEPQGMGIWRQRFHEAAYTSLLMGAVFSRAYNQPIYPETTQASSALGEEANEEAVVARRDLLDLLGKTSCRSASFSPLVIDEERRNYLSRFSVFDLNDALGSQKETFGPFIKWFFQSAILGTKPSRLCRHEISSCVTRSGPRLTTHTFHTAYPAFVGWIGQKPADSLSGTQEALTPKGKL